MGRNKMNNKKTLTSLAAASMVITQAGQMSVFAKGATADPETPAEKEETKVEKTQKELLEEKIKEAQEKLDATKKEADAKKAEAEAAKQEAEKANDAYTAQNTVVQTGYDTLNSVIDESLQPLLNEIADLEAKIAQMTVNLNAEQKASQEAEQAKNEAEVNLANKKAELENLQNQLAAMKTPEELETEYNQATEDAAKAQEATDTAQKEADEAQTAYDKALNDFNSTMSPLEQAKKNLADFEAKYATELARLNQGSKGYFDSIGASEAVNFVFDKNDSNMAIANLAKYTQMGQKDDATSLENMQASIAYMKECNEIRKKEGLSELKVSAWLMAVAQVNANRAKVKMSHSGTYATGENLAWGYGNANTAGSPYRGWYDEEKAEYLAGNHKFSETGHYQNIVEKQYTVTGFAVGTKGQFSTAHCQEFLDYTLDVDGEVVMTVSEFEQSFNNYYNSLKSVDSQHKTLQNAVNNASGSGSKDNTAVTNALNLLNAKKNALTSLQNQKVAKENERAGLQNRVNQATASYSQAVQNTKAANQKVEEAKTAKANAENALNSAKAELISKENARQTASVNVNTAKIQAKEAQNKVNTLNDRINNWTANTEKAEKNLADAKDALAKAKTRKAQLKDTFDTATDEHKKASDVFDDAKATSDEANTRLATAKENLSKKDALRNAAKKAVDTYNTASAQVESLETDIAKLADTITAKEKGKSR